MSSVERVFATFIGGPWDRRWDWVPLCDSFDILDTETRAEHTYRIAVIPMPGMKTAVYMYISAHMSLEEALFRVISCYSITPEEL